MEEILHQFQMVVIPLFTRFFYIPGGAGFLPSTVLLYRRLYATNPILLPKPFESPKKKEKPLKSSHPCGIQEGRIEFHVGPHHLASQTKVRDLTQKI